MRRFIYIFSIILILSVTTFKVAAQQVPYYNFNMINPVAFNPAFVGINDDVNVYLTRGQRYSGYGIGAVNNLLSVDGKFFIPHSGFGLTLEQKTIGITNQFSAGLSYAYHLKLAKNHQLSLGINGGYMDTKIRTEEINVMQQNDPFLSEMQPYHMTYNFNAGLVYKWKDLRVGVAVPQVVGNKVKFAKSNVRGYYTLARHFMGMVDYDFHFKKVPKLSLSPHALVRYMIGAPFEYDLGAKVEYQNIFWFSTTYKSDYAIQFNLGFHIFKNLHVGYSYEYIFGSFKNYYKGFNHEFLLGYTFRNKKHQDKLMPLPKPVMIKDTALISENEQLKRTKEDLLKRLQQEQEKNKHISDSLDALKKADSIKNLKPVVTPNKNVENSDLVVDKRYHFVDTSGVNYPSGFYVIVGVYSKNENAQRSVEFSKKLYPDAHYMVNTPNDFRYVAIYYSPTDKQKAEGIAQIYRRRTGKKVWVINYKIPE